MIAVQRFNGEEFFINPHLIETLEAAPDTTITLVTGRKFVVKTPVAEVIEQIVAYRRKIGEPGFVERDGAEKNGPFVPGKG